MSDNKADDNKSKDADQELADLLDSALADFADDKTEPGKVQEEEKVEEVQRGQEWSEDFIRQAAEQFETNISALLGGAEDGGAALSAEQVQASFQRMAEAAQAALSNPGISDPVSNDFASTISQTIQGLSQGAETLQNPFSENDIMNMFGNLSGSGEQNAFLPFMQGMMQSLLSKEVLYPSLKDILEKYPTWLQANDSKLSAEDKDRYIKQQGLMQQVCDELELEAESDSAEVRKARFDKVLSLMQSLQDYGQPPIEIVADAGTPIPFDQGIPEQCALM